MVHELMVIRARLGEGTICDHMWPYRPAAVAQVNGPYATICELTSGHVGTGNRTVCDHMWPYRPVARYNVPLRHNRP